MEDQKKDIQSNNDDDDELVKQEVINTVDDLINLIKKVGERLVKIGSNTITELVENGAKKIKSKIKQEVLTNGRYIRRSSNRRNCSTNK